MTFFILLLSFLSERSTFAADSLGFDLSFGRTVLLLFSSISIASALLYTRALSAKREGIFFSGVLLIAFLCWQVLAALMSDTASYSLKRVLNYGSLFVPVIILAVFNPKVSLFSLRAVSKETLEAMFMAALKCSLIILAIFAIYQLVTGEFLHRYEVRELLFIHVLRVNSLYPDPNFLAAFLAFSAPFFLPSGSISAWIRSKGMLFFVLCIAMIILTGSRGGFMALGAGSLYYYLSTQRWQKLWLCDLCIILFPFLIVVVSYIDFAFFVGSAYEVDDVSLSGLSRLMSWYAGFDSLLKNLLFGIGAGNYINIDKAAYIPSGLIENWRAENAAELAAHNSILEVAVEGGVVCGLLLMGFFFLVIRSGRLAADVAFIRRSCAAIVSFYVSASLLSYFPPWFYIFITFYIYVWHRTALRCSVNSSWVN